MAPQPQGPCLRASIIVGYPSGYGGFPYQRNTFAPMAVVTKTVADPSATAVSAGEIDQVRAYLKRRGVRAMPLPDGRFTMDGAMTGTVERAGLVLAALRAFVQARVVARGR